VLLVQAQSNLQLSGFSTDLVGAALVAPS